MTIQPAQVLLHRLALVHRVNQILVVIGCIRPETAAPVGARSYAWELACFFAFPFLALAACGAFARPAMKIWQDIRPPAPLPRLRTLTVI
jgi:hypothetical protein